MTNMSITKTGERNDGTQVEIDATAEQVSGKWYVMVRAAITTESGMVTETWYQDTLDTLTSADLDKLASEALESYMTEREED